MPTRVFIETTIPSSYFETRRDRRSLDWRTQTRLWWDRYRSQYELVTSAMVIAEFLEAPDSKSSLASRFFAPVTILPALPGFDRVVARYIAERVMPAGAMGDAAHLAMASMHNVDIILTWNCRHLANVNKFRHIQTINRRLGLPTPMISTPFEIMPEDPTWQQRTGET